MSRRLQYTTLLALLLPVLLVAKPPRSRPELVDFDWRGDDVVLVFNDSTGYEIDLAASDTSEVVVRFKNVAISEAVKQRAAGAEIPSGGLAISLGGRGGRSAALAQGTKGDLNLRIRDDERLGYSVEWRPYTRQLVVHTFEWRTLDDATTRFHEGLIALEQRVNDQAVELLQIAGAGGESRAHGVLASMYARRGEDSLAKYYLRDPRTAEDYAALAAVQQRAGDSTAADASRDRSQTLLADRRSDRRGDRRRGDGRRGDGRRGDRGVEADDDGPGAPPNGPEHDTGMRNSDVIVLASVGGLVLFLIIGFLVLLSRRARRTTDTPTSTTPPPVPPQPRAPGFRVVDPVAPSAARTPPSSAPQSTASPESETKPKTSTETGGQSISARGSSTSTQSDVALAAGSTSAPDARTSSSSAPDARPSNPPAAQSSKSAPPYETVPRPPSSAAHPSASPPMKPSAQQPQPMTSQSNTQSTQSTPPPTSAQSDESTVDAARRMGVSRDNVDLRRRMDDAARRDKKQR